MCRKILIYYEQKSYGGVDTHLAQLINNWPECNDRIIIVSNRENVGLEFFEKQLKIPVFKVIKIDGVFDSLGHEKNKIYRILYFVLYQIKFLLIFSKLLNKLAPDILISNNGGFPGGFTCWLASILGRTRKGTRNNTFLLVHHAPPDKRGRGWLYASFLVWLNQYLEIPVITVSKASKCALELQTPLKNIHVIYNGLERRLKGKSYDFRSKWGIEDDKIIIGMIGPIDPHKGHATILDVFHLSKYLKQSAHFVVVGSGREVLTSELKAKVKACELKAEVIFTGFMEEDSNDIISGFDILVMPTIDFEGFGYSMAEAMLSGIPVVASRVGAIPEIIVDGESGYLVEQSDISGWRVTIEKLVGNSTLRKHIGMAGKQRIESRFSAESMSRQYYNLLTANEIL